MLQEKDILYERGDYWIKKTANSFEVYRVGITHSTRCAVIGLGLSDAWERAKQECLRRSFT